ncbi:MAG: hypothetical protein VX589_11170 [Myxococcota bacterium]|nr:hypothetical protein [Myxococcota bacterium]
MSQSRIFYDVDVHERAIRAAIEPSDPGGVLALEAQFAFERANPEMIVLPFDEKGKTAEQKVVTYAIHGDS